MTSCSDALINGTSGYRHSSNVALGLQAMCCPLLIALFKQVPAGRLCPRPDVLVSTAGDLGMFTGACPRLFSIMIRNY